MKYDRKKLPEALRLRWKMVFDQVKADSEAGKDFDPKAFSEKVIGFERAWTHETKRYPTEPKSDSVFQAKRVYEEYFKEQGS